MAITTQKQGKWLVQVADGLDDVLEYAQGPKAWDGLSNEAAWASKAITKTLVETIQLGRMGWPEGRSKLSATLDAANFAQTSSAYKSESLDVAGAYPIVPAFIAGAPDCMVTIGQEQRQTRQILRFVVNMSCSGGLDPQVLITRGAAILSWVDKLEAQGARCEVLMTACGDGGKFGHSLSFFAKRADEPLDVDKLAFVMVHPAMFRRIYFATQERHAETAFGKGHGMPTDFLPDAIACNHSIYFGRMLFGESHWKEPKAALAEVERVIKSAVQYGDGASHLMTEA